MNTILIVLAVIIVAAVVVYIGMKQGKIKDSDGDLIPDAVEDAVDKIEDVVDDVEEVLDEVKSRAKNVAKELGDVVSAVKGKPTKAKLNKLTKQQLVDSAAADFDTELDVSVRKSTLVNKVYSLYNS
jgi:hypothetical protein